MTDAPSPVRVRPCGPRAFLLEVDSPASAAAIAGEIAGVEEVVPGATTVLVHHDGRADIDASVRAAVQRGARSDVAHAGPRREVVIEVVYDGEDLVAVAERTGLSVEAVVTAHTAAVHEVAFCGFAPGFAYLTGLPPALEVPRLATPRARVPAGSVAIAGRHSAVYPTASPGGWNLLGRTATRVWDVAADPPALLTPGTRVRFVAIAVVS